MSGVVHDGDSITGGLSIDAGDAHEATDIESLNVGALLGQQTLIPLPVVPADGGDERRGHLQRPQRPSHVDALAAGGYFHFQGAHHRSRNQSLDDDGPVEDRIGIHDDYRHRASLS